MLCLACACKYSGPRHGVRDTATEYAHSKSLEIVAKLVGAGVASSPGSEEVRQGQEVIVN